MKNYIYKILQLKLNAYKPDNMSDSCTKNSQIYGKVKVTSAVCHAAAAAISTWQRGKQRRTGKYCAVWGCKSTHVDNVSLHLLRKENDRPVIRK